MIDDILTLMRDGQRRTSYEICDALFGPQPDGKRWWQVSGACEQMCVRRELREVAIDAQHRSVYVAA